MSEEEIGAALYRTLAEQHKLVEGAAAMAIACVIKDKNLYGGKNIVVVSCGSNISIESVKQIIMKHGQ